MSASAIFWGWVLLIAGGIVGGWLLVGAIAYVGVLFLMDYSC